MTTPSVHAEGVSKRFGSISAVSDLNLEVLAGEFFALLGPSGCGKTTTLRMICGLQRPDGGEVFIHGQRVTAQPPYRRNVGMVFQHLALFPSMSVAGNIGYGLKLQHLPAARVRARVGQMIDLLQLGGLEKRRLNQLSGGQLQRVALARSLVRQPQVLLLDEPLASLDRMLRLEMQAQLRRLQRELGTTFIYVTHDQREALALSDRVAVMHEGKMIQIGTPRQVYEQPRTPFVAEFMGFSNGFVGQLVHQQAGQVRVCTSQGVRLVASVSEPLSGDRVSVHLRPQAVQVHPGAQQPVADNAWRGKVISQVFLGEMAEVRVALDGGGAVTAHVPPNAVALHEGQTVWVSWGATQCVALVS